MNESEKQLSFTRAAPSTSGHAKNQIPISFTRAALSTGRYAKKQIPISDITGELAKAYKARGLKFLTTFHHGFAWQYFQPAFGYDAADGKNFQLYSEPHGAKDPPSQRYQEQWLAMVMEVVHKFHPRSA